MQVRDFRSEPPHRDCRLDPAAIREQLERILASASFRNSRRHSCFLRFVVEEALEGNADRLKERSIGAQVFGLDPAYDTSTNPVVRVSAGELRKRMVQYYHSPERREELVIELPAGSYVPEFRLPLEQSPQPLPAAAPTIRRGVVYMAAFVALALAALVLWWRPWTPRDPFTRFWAPVWDSPGQVLIIVAAQPRTDSGGAPVPGRMSLGDAIALARLTPVLHHRNKDFRVMAWGSATLADLKQGPAIFIGAFSNELTMRLTRETRFNFEMDPQTRNAWIKDRQNPSSTQWRMDWPGAGEDASYTDYAIISRVVDPTTGQVAVVAAGFTSRGTRAAGEFLGSRSAMAAISGHLEKGWPDRNVQVVLAIPVTPAASGPARVLTAYSW